MLFLKTFWNDETGVVASEYALLLAVIAAGLAVAVGALGTAISDSLNDATVCINTDGVTCN